MSIKTYQFIVELEDDPVTPFTSREIREIGEHIANAMNAGIELPSKKELMYLNNGFTIETKVKE